MAEEQFLKIEKNLLFLYLLITHLGDLFCLKAYLLWSRCIYEAIGNGNSPMNSKITFKFKTADRKKKLFLRIDNCEWLI